MKIKDTALVSTSNYDIFKSLPYKRVVDANQKSEIFDLYQLGSFTVTDASIFTALNKEQTKQEHIELVELQAKTIYRPHYHKNSSAIIYICIGTGIFILGKQQIEYQPGKRVLIPAGTSHGFKTNTCTLFLSIQSPSIVDPVTGQIDIHYDEVLSNENK